ncbi:MAG: glycerophosphodiester phosphodiesterase [Limnochordia bacterium]|jgi:glycerophosphoryl diester phosphodiesterase
MRQLVIAHRGFSAIAPENTLLAFQKARDVGADGIEIDVHLTGDGEVVVLHDEKVNRTTNGSGYVGDMTLAQVQELDAGSWFSAEAAGQRIPTLEQVCAFVADWGGWFNIEIKTTHRRYDGIEQKVLDLIRAYNIVDQVFISSFNHESLRLVRELDPSIATAALYSEQLHEPWNYVKTFSANALHPAHRTVTAEVVSKAHAAGIAVRPWTIDDLEAGRMFFNYGVDAIITNRPDLMLQVLGRA